MTPFSHVEIPVKPETEQPNKPKMPRFAAPEIRPAVSKSSGEPKYKAASEFFNPNGEQSDQGQLEDYGFSDRAHGERRDSGRSNFGGLDLHRHTEPETISECVSDGPATASSDEPVPVQLNVTVTFRLNQ
jgi:hypothetical protein